MGIEVKEAAAPSKLTARFKELMSAAVNAGFTQVGWLKVTVFRPLTVLAFVSPDKTATLAIMGSAAAEGLTDRGVELVTSLDSGVRITTTTEPTAESSPKRRIFKFAHPKADIAKLLRFHSEHCQEHKGEPLPAPATVQAMASYVREYLDYEMEGSIHRYWLVPARTKPSETRRVETPEGCYVSADSLSIRVIMDDGKYIWGGFDIHDSGTYKILHKDETTCDIEFTSQVGGSDKQLHQLTREGKKYLFTPLPERDSPEIFRRIDGGEFLEDSKGRKVRKPTLAEGAPTGEYQPVSKLVEEFETGFVQNVRKEVIPYLIESGVLEGKKVKKEWHLLDNEKFRRMMHFGIERFVLNQQGWTFVAIQAPMEAVAKTLRARKEVVKYTENVPATKLRDEAEIAFSEGKRHTFIVKFPHADWSVLIQTVHWIAPEDPTTAVSLAEALSKELQTKAIAAWDDDCSGSGAMVFERGKKKEELSTEMDSVQYDARFYSEGIYLSEAFIAGTSAQAELMLSNPASVERVDYAQISIS